MRKLLLLMIFGLILGCNTAINPTSPDVPDPVVTPPPVAETPVVVDEIEYKGCEVLNVKQRRHRSKNIIILEVWPKEGVTRLVAKFRVDGGEIHKQSIVGNIRLEIELPLECREREYKVEVWVEGYFNGKLYQCDGSVHFTWKCKPKKPECSLPSYGGFYGERKWHGDRFDVYAGYGSLRGKGSFKLVLRRHRCASQLLLGVDQHCHPGDWSDEVSLDCFTGSSLQLVAKNQESAYRTWCYTSELYLDGNLKEMRRIN